MCTARPELAFGGFFLLFWVFPAAALRTLHGSNVC